MSEFTLEPDALKFARALAEGPEILTRNMARTLPRILATIARGAKREAPKAFSLLVNSINHQLLSPFEGVVFAGVDYSQAQETGTGIFGPRNRESNRFPPVDAIQDWISVRRIVPQTRGVDERDLAFLIARKIAMTGTHAQPYMEPALQANEADAIKRIDDTLDRTLQEIARKG